MTLLSNHRMSVTGIVHIGAHTCEELVQYNQGGISTDKVIWFEAMQELVDRCVREIPRVRIYQAVLSNVDGQETNFIVTNNYQSSSLLELKDHLVMHPDIHEIRRDRVVTTTFKTYIEKNKVDVSFANFLNLDIQGMELPVLAGMGKYLDSFKYIYTEVNTRELYKNCTLLNELDLFLNIKGFARVDIAMTSWGWGDALYIRRD